MSKTFSDVAAATQVLQQTQSTGNPLLTGVEYDSRRVQPGALFVAMHGESTDGNRYIQSAIEKGAAAVVTDSADAFAALQQRQFPAALVQYGRRALAEMSAEFFSHPEKKLKLHGVTGTNGKTTTAFLLESILRSAHRSCVLVGTVEYHVGDEVLESPHTTPESRDLMELFARGVTVGASDAVMEMSSHALEQERVWGLHCDTAIFTNLTQDHLDYHGSMENYLAAKRRLFEGVGAAPPRVAVLNADDTYSDRMAPVSEQQKMTYGIHGGEYRAEEIVLAAGSTQFLLKTPQGDVEVQTQLTGRVNVYNALAAICAAVATGVPLPLAATGASALAHVPGRFQVVRGSQPFTVVVDYAHTPDALRNLTQLARELAGTTGRVITLFGCGGNRDRGKRPLMGQVAGEGSDLVVLTSDNPRNENPQDILQDAVPGVIASGTKYIVEADRRAAIGVAIAEARPGDMVLLAGKGHEKVQMVGDAALPFDDVAVAEEYLKSAAKFAQ